MTIKRPTVKVKQRGLTAADRTAIIRQYRAARQLHHDRWMQRHADGEGPKPEIIAVQIRGNPEFPTIRAEVKTPGGTVKYVRL